MRLILASWIAWIFSKEWQEGQPAFYQFAFHLDQVEDTFLDMTGFGKGSFL